MILADTGYFIALLNPGDALHARATAWAPRVGVRVMVTEYVALEVVNFYSRSRRRTAGGGLVHQIRQDSAYEWVEASTDLFDRGLSLHQARRDKGWSLTDCTSFVLMRDRGVVAALAFDEHFVQAGFDALLRRDPP